jgi:hypothetical protein
MFAGTSKRRQMAGLMPCRVAVQPAHYATGGLRESLVDCVRLPVVFFANPVSQPICITADDIRAAIGATTIDDNVFEI